MQNSKRFLNSASGVGVLLVAVLSVYIISSRLFFRLDVTSDRVYTLSKGSKKIASELKDPVNLKLYYSRTLKDTPVMLKTYATRVQEVLQEFVSRSGGKLTLEVIDPKPDSDEEVAARKAGINGVRTPSGDELFLGLALASGDKESAIPYFDPRKEEFLEYDISEALIKLTITTKPKVGVLSSLPIMGQGAPQGMAMGSQGGEAWIFIEQLKNFFDVEKIDVSTEKIVDDINVLLVIHPKQLPPAAEFAIDQFVMRGGRLIVAVDPFSRTDLASNPAAGMMGGGRMPESASSLDALFNAWGIQYSRSDMVGDTNRATRINAMGEAVNYPFFMSLTEEDFTKEVMITANLKQMMIAEGGAISLKDGTGYQLTPLIQTTKDTGMQNASMAMFMRPGDLSRELKPDGKQRIIAGLLKGKFKSAFATGAPQGLKTATDVIKEASEEGNILLVADVDFMADANAVDKMNFGPQVIVRPRNDNLNFMLNAVEFLAGNKDLISIRSSGRVARPFTKVMQLQKDAQARWKSEEDRLNQQLSDLQKKLNDLQQQRTDGNLANLTSEQQGEIQRFREQEAEVRAKRREVRKKLREDIEGLGHLLVALNMLAVPSLVAAAGVMVFVRREKRAKGEV